MLKLGLRAEGVRSPSNMASLSTAPRRLGSRIDAMPRRLLIAIAVLAAFSIAAFAAWWMTRAPLVPAVSARLAPLVRTLQFSARVATSSRV
jgi:hypothetical protein